MSVGVTELMAVSVFLATKHAARGMMKTSGSKPYPGGSIIGTASVAGLRSNAGATDYSASKAAVVSIMQTTAYQLVGTGIRCNAVCPGIIETGMTSVMYDAARKRGTERKIGQLNPLMRGGVADEVARVVAFLGSDSASYVNGQAWAVSYIMLLLFLESDTDSDLDRWTVDSVQGILLYQASWHDITKPSMCRLRTTGSISTRSEQSSHPLSFPPKLTSIHPDGPEANECPALLLKVCRTVLWEIGGRNTPN